MIRTVVYRSRMKSLRGTANEESPVYGATVGPLDASSNQLPADGITGRVTKYIPAETLAVILPAVLFSAGSTLLILGFAVLGAFGTPFYLLKRAKQDQAATGQLPSCRYYLIATVAYAAWIIASAAPLRRTIGLREQYAGALVMAAAYLLPLLDDALDRSTR